VRCLRRWHTEYEREKKMKDGIRNLLRILKKDFIIEKYYHNIS